MSFRLQGAHERQDCTGKEKAGKGGGSACSRQAGHRGHEVEFKAERYSCGSRPWQTPQHSGAPEAMQQALADMPHAKLLSVTMHCNIQSPFWHRTQYLCLYAKDGPLQTRPVAENEAGPAWAVHLVGFLLEPVLAEVASTYLRAPARGPEPPN